MSTNRIRNVADGLKPASLWATNPTSDAKGSFKVGASSDEHFVGWAGRLLSVFEFENDQRAFRAGGSG